MSKPVSVETPEEIAERIAGFSLVAFHDNQTATRAQIAADVLSALKARDERAAKIAENYASGTDMLRRDAETVIAVRQGIAAAIREGKE